MHRKCPRPDHSPVDRSTRPPARPNGPDEPLGNDHPKSKLLLVISLTIGTVKKSTPATTPTSNIVTSTASLNVVRESERRRSVVLLVVCR